MVNQNEGASWGDTPIMGQNILITPSLFIVAWNERSGPEIIKAFPETDTLPRETLFQVYLNHHGDECSQLVSMGNDQAAFSSFYFGTDAPVYLVYRSAPDIDHEAIFYRFYIVAEVIKTISLDPQELKEKLGNELMGTIYNTMTQNSEYE